MIDIKTITRKNILSLTAYSSARNEFNGEAEVWLDANESPFDTSINRYPDPQQSNLKKAVAKLNSVNQDQLFIGNGSDEAIDLLFRAFCEPGDDKAYIFPPTYGMYEVSAQINNVEVVHLPLIDDLEIPSFTRLAGQIECGGLIFICSPNNPIGNITGQDRIRNIANNFSGLVVIDEAYIEFSDGPSAIQLINEISNLVVLRTFSKAFGAAGLRIGMAFANPCIIEILNKIKPPYNVNCLSQSKALEVLENFQEVSNQITIIKSEREKLTLALTELSSVIKVYPSQANFILVEFKNSNKVFKWLLENGIVIRDRSSLLKNCLRISIGTPVENEKLYKALK